jgi:hypothetical protein
MSCMAKLYRLLNDPHNNQLNNILNLIHDSISFKTTKILKNIIKIIEIPTKFYTTDIYKSF